MQVIHVDEDIGRALLAEFYNPGRCGYEIVRHAQHVEFAKEFCATFGYNYQCLVEEGRFIKPC